MIHDLSRPDVNGVAPKMQAIGDQATVALQGLAPDLHVITNDNLCSSVLISGSLDAKETWVNGIFLNSRYFRFSLHASKGRRYYSEGDQVTVEGSAHYSLPKLRKYTGTPEKCIERIAKWMRENA